MEWKYLKYDLEYRWQNFKLKQWLENNPIIVISAASISVLILLIVMLCLVWPSPSLKYESPTKAWYYDLNTGKLFADKANLLLPIDAPSGQLSDGSPAGVLAFVYTYDNRGSKSESQFIAFLAIDDFNSNVNHAQAKNWLDGKLIKTVESKRWVPVNSTEGRKIINDKLGPDSNGKLPRFLLP